MADSLKMAILKKAYAEIILNTSKEAAAKIMAAERKASCFQKELIALKEEALRMLVHLKQMIDSKAVEEEIRSADQQRKIEELDAQLSEAEGIIVDLREELRLTEDKLERVKFSQNQQLECYTLEDSKNLHLPSNDALVDKTDDGRYCAIQYSSPGNAKSTKNSAEMTLRGASSDQLICSAGEQLPAVFSPLKLSNCNTFSSALNDLPPSNEHSSSCSPNLDEKDIMVTSNGTKAKPLAHEGPCGQAVLQRSSSVCCDECCHPSFSHCKSCPAELNEAPIQVPEENGMHPAKGSYLSTSRCESNHEHVTSQDESYQYPLNKLRYKETEGDHPSDVPVDCKLHDVQNSKGSERTFNQADSERVLKFTFQRKRKRDVLTKLDDNITNVKDKVIMEQGNATEPPKSVLRDEQSKDNQQDLLGAHQHLSSSAASDSSGRWVKFTSDAAYALV